MSKSSEKTKEETSTFVSPARRTRQPVGLYSRFLQMKEENTPRIQRKRAIGSNPETFVYPKLDVVEADDPSEKEADATADRVMASPESDTEERAVQTKQISGAINRSRLSGGADGSNNTQTASYVHGLSGGQPLSKKERDFYEPRFGADFSNVRVHNDPKAHEAAQSINAKAFTIGNNVVMGKGQYSPDSSSGKHLMAHELTHTVQQSGGVQKASVQRTPLSRDDESTEVMVEFIESHNMQILGIAETGSFSPFLHAEYLIKGNKNQWKSLLAMRDSTILPASTFFRILVQPFLSATVNTSYVDRFIAGNVSQLPSRIQESVRSSKTISDDDKKEFLWAIYGDVINEESVLIDWKTKRNGGYFDETKTVFSEFISHHFHLIFDELMAKSPNSLVQESPLIEIFDRSSPEILQGYLSTGMALLEVGMTLMAIGKTQKDSNKEDQGENFILNCTTLIAAARNSFIGQRAKFKTTASAYAGVVKGIVGIFTGKLPAVANVLVGALLDRLNGIIVDAIVKFAFQQEFDRAELRNNIALFLKTLQDNDQISNDAEDSVLSYVISNLALLLRGRER